MGNRAIIDAIREISGAGNATASLHIGTVKQVDEDKYTCTCRLETGGGVDMPGVKLMLNPDDGQVGFPAIGSQVLIIMQSWGDPYVIMTTELDKLDTITNKEIYLHVDKSTLQLTPEKINAEFKEGGSVTLSSDGVKLNDGSYGGLVIVEKTVEEINTLRSEINKIKSAITAQSPIDSPAKAQTVLSNLTAWAAQQLTPIAGSDIENPNITHGNI